MHRLGLCFVVVLLTTATTLLGSQHKTPWGDPDLQGIWSNQTPTPLERPEALAGKATFTEQEAAEFEKTSLDRLLTIVRQGSADQRRVERASGWKRAKGKVPPGRSTSLVVDPPDGKIPYTPEGLKRWEAVPKIGKPMLANAPEDRTEAERCLTTEGSTGAESVLQQLLRDRAGAGLRGDRDGDDARDARHPARPASARRRGCAYVDM